MELFIRLIVLFKTLIYQITRPYFWYINRQPGQKISPIKNPILKMSAVTIAEKIRHKELKCETVVSAYVERIKEVNPILNAVVDERFEAAIEEAKIFDEKLASGEVNSKQLEIEQPLYGVPITVKESCGLKGLSHTGGSYARIGIKANYDGTAVLNLKNAGAIPLCVTNTPELCLGFESKNHLFGTTNNPYDVRRTAGGSSGGEGALLGSAASLIGIGSDIAGSIRAPAFFNGVFGHKPTPGIISIDGHFPISDDSDFRRNLVTGPMARYVEDLELAFKIMADEKKNSLGLDHPVDVKSLKVRYMEEIEQSFGLISPNKDVKNTVRKAAGYLEDIGADVKKVNIERLKDSLEIGLALFMSINDMPQILLNPDDPKHENNALTELMKLIFGLSKHTASPVLLKLLLDINALIPQSKIPWYRLEAQKLHRTFTDLLGTDGVFLFPTYICSAPLHNQLILKVVGVMYCFIFNILGFPSTQVPIGFDSEGLPIGLQVIAAPMQDRLCIAVAKELGKGFGGWIPPPTAV